ncbi:histidine phosphatase family protein [Geminicoccaceae bacterium 1502E]|nr:histidine phosphatase family protein [Geminicoccaceae bacterium 1502E]
MRELCLVRHGLTGWNTEGRIQGRTDVPLCEEGRREVRGWRLPPGFERARCLSSPLERALETARLLGFAEPAVDPRLVEMAWGAWEGERLDALRDRHGEAFARAEALGLDFVPPGGESPRMVMARLAGLLGELAQDGGGPLVIVAHKGVLRAAMVLATGWPMLGRPPFALHHGTALLAGLDRQGRLGAMRAVDLGNGP